MEPDEAWCQNLAAVQTAVERGFLWEVKSGGSPNWEDAWAIV